MILTLDVGNTETVAGIFDGDELVAHWRLSTHPERTVDEYGILLRSLLRESEIDAAVIDGAVVASVVPPLTHALTAACARYLDADPLVLEPGPGLPIRLETEEPLSVGADRIANTIAASRMFGVDTIVVDLGTATTFDCIAAEGAFLGGIIAPGVRTGSEMLTRRTARLPRVDFEPPDQVIGRRTDTALQSGIFLGAVESIDGIVRRIGAEWGNQPLVVATGGLAQLLAPHCHTVDRIEPFLTLHGLRLAWEETGR
jgi:type III pantothenate kinase